MIIKNNKLLMEFFRWTAVLTITALALAPVNAQTLHQAVTKRIEKTFSYRDGYEVNIEGEKAEVVIETWDRPEVRVVLELTARHPDKKVAERDLEAVRYQTEKVKNRIYIRNYVSPVEGASQPESAFSARYAISLPPDCPVYLKNNFGIANISNLVNRLRINSEFTKLGLQNIQGFLDVRTRFGDLRGEQISGDVIINARRSDLTLRDINGRFDITSQYGILEILAGSELIDLKIDAEKSDVFLYAPNPSLFAYNLQGQHSDMVLPSELEFRVLDDKVALKKATFKPQQEYFANITITISFGELTVEKPPKGVKP